MKKRKKIRPASIVLILFLAFLLFAPHQNYLKTDVVNTFAAPSAEHWFGTDNLGRDIYALLLAGGVRTLEVVAIATMISFLFGSLLGMAAGYYGGIAESMIQFVSDFSLIIPSFVVAMILSALFGFSVTMAGVVFGIWQMGELSESGDGAHAEPAEAGVYRSGAGAWPEQTAYHFLSCTAKYLSPAFCIYGK